MKVSRVRLLLLFVGLSGLILVLLQATSGERRASASGGKSLLAHLRRDRVPPILEVPAGTHVHVRIKDRITDRNRAGDIFLGRLDRDVEESGKVLIPQGSRVIGRITRLGADMKRPGSTEVSLVLEQMMAGEKVIPLDSLAVTLSTPATVASPGPSALSLQVPGFLPQQQSIEEPGEGGKKETIYEPNTRLTFVLAERLRLPVFVPPE